MIILPKNQFSSLSWDTAPTSKEQPDWAESLTSVKNKSRKRFLKVPVSRPLDLLEGSVCGRGGGHKLAPVT